MKYCSNGHSNSEDALFCTMCSEFFFKRRRVWLLSLLTIITHGIFVPVWFLRIRKLINGLPSTEKLGRSAFVFLILVFIASLASNILAVLLNISASIDINIKLLITERTSPYPYNQMMRFPCREIIGSVPMVFVFITLLSGYIIALVQSFKVKRILAHHFNHVLNKNITFSGIMIFFFNIMYLQYKINKLK